MKWSLKFKDFHPKEIWLQEGKGGGGGGGGTPAGKRGFPGVKSAQKTSVESIGLFSRNTQFKVAVWNWISERPNGWVLNARVQQCLFNVVKSAVY